MLNHNAKKQAIQRLQVAQKQYEALVGDVMKQAQALFELRQSTAESVIQACEDYINTLANSPREFDKSVTAFKVSYQEFTNLSHQIEVEAKQQAAVRQSTVGAGVVAGAGVAALGPSAAMVIATTFGTASTGTAISALSGAAATNAALAWLGGGALAAGGSGMVGGQALLALAGPVGWTIGGIAVAGGALWANGQNEKAARQATQYTHELELEIGKLRVAKVEVDSLKNLTEKHADGVLAQLALLEDGAPADYRQFSTDQKQALAALNNHIQSLGKLLNQTIA
ncbi:hypothetical protein [Phormidium sp. FACHB-1136]|uniref:hypothetical protein n=1 Tax=Phormidium sp. FACHB-1136 TaxID=2692848 RepID=UPI001686CB40|nr:hypothetical protein [Phormidium sp. FACHB-1136]MBD2426030.1 hypothetical protein [Phormidium sp. FACHB-1136]